MNDLHVVEKSVRKSKKDCKLIYVIYEARQLTGCSKYSNLSKNKEIFINVVYVSSHQFILKVCYKTKGLYFSKHIVEVLHIPSSKMRAKRPISGATDMN